jgi:exopolyphosphatase/guanosine-5'-triphosphate,3'-diphosphate pyrophosphatase
MAFPNTASMVAGWTAGIVQTDGPDRRERLRLAATMLCMASATVEPNLRGDLAHEWGLRKRWIGATARPRDARRRDDRQHRQADPARRPLRPRHPAAARGTGLGLAARLCRRFTVGASALNSTLRREGETLVMEVEDRHAVLINDSVGRDLKALGAHLGLKAAIRERSWINPGGRPSQTGGRD